MHIIILDLSADRGSFRRDRPLRIAHIPAIETDLFWYHGIASPHMPILQHPPPRRHPPSPPACPVFHAGACAGAKRDESEGPPELLKVRRASARAVLRRPSSQTAPEIGAMPPRVSSSATSRTPPRSVRIDICCLLRPARRYAFSGTGLRHAGVRIGMRIDTRGYLRRRRQAQGTRVTHAMLGRRWRAGSSSIAVPR